MNSLEEGIYELLANEFSSSTLMNFISLIDNHSYLFLTVAPNGSTCKTDNMRIIKLNLFCAPYTIITICFDNIKRKLVINPFGVTISTYDNTLIREMSVKDEINVNIGSVLFKYGKSANK